MAKKKKTISISLVSIKEVHSQINKMLIDEISESDDVAPSISIDFVEDMENDIFQVNCTSKYEYNNEIIVQVDFLYTLKIEDLKSHMVDNNYKFPEEIWKIILSDVFCTARIFISGKLINTKMEDLFLPFGGQINLINNYMKNQ